MNSIINKGTSVLNNPLNLTKNLVTSSKPSFLNNKDISPTAILSDYFYKKGDFVQSWKNRYFILYKVEVDDVIHFYIQYFTGPNHKTEQGTIYPIKGISKTTTTNLLRSSKDFGFTIVTGGSRKFYLSTKDSKIVNNWIQSITDLLNEIGEGEYVPTEAADVSDEEHHRDEDAGSEINFDSSDEDEENSKAINIDKSRQSIVDTTQLKSSFDDKSPSKESYNSKDSKDTPNTSKDITNEISKDDEDYSNDENTDIDEKKKKIDIRNDFFSMNSDSSNDSDDDWVQVSSQDAKLSASPNKKETKTEVKQESKQELSANNISPIEEQWKSIEVQGSQARQRRMTRLRSNTSLPNNNETQKIVTESKENKSNQKDQKESKNTKDTNNLKTQNVTNTISYDNLPSNVAPIDLMDSSLPIDIESQLFSDNDIITLLKEDHREKTLNKNIRQDIVSTLNNCDDLQLFNEKSVTNILQAYGEETIHFSGILKIIYKEKTLNYCVALTSQSIYLFSKKEFNSFGVDNAPIPTLQLTSPISNPFGGEIGKAVFNTLNTLSPLEIAKKKVTYEFKERIEIRSITYLLLSQAHEQTQLLSILVPTCETDLILDFTFNSKKDEFIQFLIVNITLQLKKNIECTLVYNIMDYTRKIIGETKPTPVSFKDDDTIKSSPNDFCKIADKLVWRTKFKQYEENIILFSQVAEKFGSSTSNNKKDSKVLIIVTKPALYVCSNEDDGVVKRRIDKVDINYIGIATNDQESVLISIPSEYDILVKLANRTNFINCFENIDIIKSDNLSNKANFSKVEAQKKEKAMNDPTYIKKVLQNAISDLNRYKLKLYIEKAKNLKLENEIEYKEANKILNEMNRSETLRKEWNRAWREVNQYYLYSIIKKSQTISIMKDFTRENRKILNRMINITIINRKISDLLNISIDNIKETTTLDPDQLNYILSILKRAKLNDMLLDFQKQIDNFNQKLSLIKKLKVFEENHDRDGLIFIKESAQKLKFNTTFLKNIEKKISNLTTEDKCYKELKLAIENALENDDFESLIVILQQQTYLEYESTKKLVEEGKTIVEYIRQRIEYKHQFENDLSANIINLGTLQNWIEATKDDDYFESQRRTAEAIIHEQVKQKEQITKVKEKFKSILNKCKTYEDEAHEELLREIIEATKHFRKELEPQYSIAETLLLNRQKKRLEQKEIEINQNNDLNEDSSTAIHILDLLKDFINISNSKDIFVEDRFNHATQLVDLRYKIQDAIASQKKSQLQKIYDENLDCLKEDESLLDEVKKTLDWMHEQSKLKENIDQFVINNSSTSEIQAFINQYNNRLSEELRLKVQTVQELAFEREDNISKHILKLEQVLENWNKFKEFTLTYNDSSNPIQLIIASAKPYATYSPKIDTLIKKIINNIQNPASIHPKNIPQNVQLSNNPYINDIHQYILNILKTCNENNITSEGKFRIQQSQSKVLISKIYNILTHKVKSFYFRERTLFDICKGLTAQGTQYALKSFETSSPPMKDPNAQSINFLQYLIEYDYFTHFIQELFMQEKYISKCYNNDSILSNDRNRDELLSVFMLMNQFKFQNPIESSDEEAMISNPITLLKQSIHNIVLFFKKIYENSNKFKDDVAVGEEINIWENMTEDQILEINNLVDKLSNCLLEIFQNSRKNAIYKTNTWNLIQKIAQQRETEAVIDIGGIFLPELIYNVKEVTRLSSQAGQTQKRSDFGTFVACALNYNQLGNIIESILLDNQLSKYYAGNHALVLNSESKNIIISMIHKLDLFTFRLSL